MTSSHFDLNLAAQIRAASGFERLSELVEADGLDAIDSILDEAAKFSVKWFAPLNSKLDREGCRLVDGRVRTAAGHKEAWAAYREAGWPTLNKPVEYGGTELPTAVWAACQEIFDRGCVAFGMAAVGQTAAARLIAAHADADIQAEWLPKLTTGEWGATICISEPDAGSDVNRIRTTATQGADGTWSITGEKMWISFGDHDLAERIGHCLLARTDDGGLTLFLIPDSDQDGARNGVYVRRIEEKLGLHGSPTCALGFEGAKARLMGRIGRGLSELFTMITLMRLSVGIQGIGIAASAAQTALEYAADRRQGGPPTAPPLPIRQHADIQRLLMRCIARVEVLRGLVYTAAVQSDLAALETDEAAAEEARLLCSWLLPIIKTLGGEFASEVSSDAIQVLGGAGYTKEWSVEQCYRDARVFTIYEGTTGMQALDLLHRRLWRDGGAGLKAFLRAARRDLALCSVHPDQLERTIDTLEDVGARFMASRDARRDAEAGATHLLNLAGLAATGWIAARLTMLDAADPAVERLRAAGGFWLSDLAARAELEKAGALAGAERLAYVADADRA